MDVRLLRGALWRRRSAAGLAVLAVTIGTSVASALLHVSGDVSRKLTRELRALGPNLLVVPAEPRAEPASPGATQLDGGLSVPASRFLDEAEVRGRLARAGVVGAPLLYVAARLEGAPTTVIGADWNAVRRLHPGWKLSPAAGKAPGSTGAPVWLGARLARRLEVPAGGTLRLEAASGDKNLAVAVAGTIESGGPDDEACWVPLAEAQALSGLSGRVSLVQARVEGGATAATAVIARVSSSAIDVLPLYALTATEGRLLERMRRLMALVTVAALLAAGLCAFGSLTDLALERRREIALMKALGATRREIVRQFAVESLTIGTLGGVLGWLLGLGMAQIIGREVFHSAIAPRLDVPLEVLALSLAVALVASLGPVRLALAVEPALALKGE